MTDDRLTAAVNDALDDAIIGDLDLAEQAVAVHLAAALNRMTAKRPHAKPVDPRLLLAVARGEQVLSATEIAARLGLDPVQVQEFMDDPDDEIEIPPTAMRGFDDVFGPPRMDGPDDQ